METVAVIGLGEAGRVFVEDLRAIGHEVVGYDATADSTSRAARNARDLGLDLGIPLHAVVGTASLVVSAVTPGSCLAVARATAPHLRRDAWYFDINSASPAHKREAAAQIDGAAGRYVEAALMAAINPRRLHSPFLLGGPSAPAFAQEASKFGLSTVAVANGQLGAAAATKLCRSVVVKGMEALFTEALLSARMSGVENEVLASLSNMLPTADWEMLARYFVGRSLVHGVRRSEEMDEAAATVTDTGVQPWMASATAQRQRWAGELAVPIGDGGLDEEPRLAELLDAVLHRAGILSGASTKEVL